MSEKYKIYVDDNYHYMDESERHAADSYSSLGEAVERCKEITVKSLEDLYENGITPEELSAQWAIFGEDPFVFGGDGPVPFSARKFVTTELCRTVIESRKKLNQD